MLYSTVTPEQKRRSLREKLSSGRIQQFPGAFNPLSARLIGDKGFAGVYISGAVIAADLGLPDIGLTTLTEVAQRAGQMARMTDLPCLVDADTGFGEPMNVARSVQELENAGLAGCHIEDQFNPKRCGHLDGKNVVDLDTAAKRIRAAADARRDPDFLIMARTDIRGTDTLEAAQDRARALVEAGADAIFPEAMRSLDEFRAIREAVDVPILANMTEFGKSELFTVDELEGVGVNLVIYPVTLLRSAMGAAERTLDSITAHGTQEAAVDQMQTRSRLYELVDYEGYNRFDSSVFNFEVPQGYPSAAPAAGTTFTGQNPQEEQS
ncbi:methylisocitrate lyase [Arthrobacter echini]|uniref:Methylisocitrate lyase n=1 Tax=Arthrobacter echini TaxID=1529066 RepID=A0A4S5E0S2_9MICC|nr:methylisocitrate lyase [Arthrobacter echini]THJ64862.1 methylisocitrate lyase [Arthrobacter echini]